MMPIIIFNSHTGFTEAYARILSEALKCPAVPLKKLSETDITLYDTIIYGGAVRASKITGFNKILQILQKNPDKKAVIFAVGGNGLSSENTQIIKKQNFEAKKVNYPLFYMQGGFDPNKLNFALRAMLKSVAKSIKKKEAKDPDSLSRKDREFLEFFQDAHDNVKIANTEALMKYLSSLE